MDGEAGDCPTPNTLQLGLLVIGEIPEVCTEELGGILLLLIFKFGELPFAAVKCHLLLVLSFTEAQHKQVLLALNGMSVNGEPSLSQKGDGDLV